MADDLRIVVYLPRDTEERADDAKHHQQVGDEEKQVVACAQDATTLRDRDDRSEHEPSGDITSSSCREGEVP